MPKLKVDLHIHTREDTEDLIAYSACRLLDRAEELGFDALAITGHNTLIEDRDIQRRAERKGILLIPGMEATLSGKHVLIINPGFRANPRNRPLSDLARIKNGSNLIIAPHPFFPQSKSLKKKFLEHSEWFDAVEFSHYYNRLVDCNRLAVRAAERLRLPMVGTSDCHHLFEFGTTYSLIEAEKDTPAIIDAVKRGRVEVRTTPLPSLDMARIAALSLSMKLRLWVRNGKSADPSS